MATRTAGGPSGPLPEDVQASAVPRLVPGLVDRPRLFALLDRGAMGRATVLSAPAGSGKTMLLASWLRTAALPGPAPWVAVERDEQDPARFWRAVLEALRRSGAIAADDPLATLAPAPGDAQDEFLGHLLDGLGRLAQTVVLILDDLHHLRTEAGLRGIERLLERMPPELRLILASRHELKLGLHRLRLAGELVEIRADDLQFTAEEAAALIAGAGVDARRARAQRRRGARAGAGTAGALAPVTFIRIV